MHWLDEIDNRLKENWEEQYSLWYKGVPDEGKLEEKAREVRELLLDPSLLEVAEKLLRKGENTVRRRKAEIVKKKIIQAKIEYDKRLFNLRNEIEKKADNFLPSIGGKKVKINGMSNILMRSKNRGLRKEAYYSWKPLLDSIENQARESIKLANKLANEAGFKSYPDLIFSFENLSHNYLSKIRRNIKKNTERVWREFLEKSKKEISDLQIYDSRFMFYKFFLPPDKYFAKEEMMGKLKSTLGAFGIDMNSLPVKVETQNMACSGGCYNLKMGEDIRITYNPVGGYMDYRALFHEFGHAMHYLYLPRSFLLMDEQSFKEGMAEIWSGFIDTKEWLQKFTSMPENKIEAFLNVLELDEAYHYRQFIKELSFELELYKNPEANFGSVWQGVSKKYLEINDDSGIWSEFVFSAPLCMKDYILAKLIENSTFHFFRKEFSEIIGNREVIGFLIEKYYKPGNFIPWQEKMERATGERV